jgi:hypothetical protein
MQVANTPPNREIADTIRERIKVRNAQINANARIINAKARAWTLAGFGTMVAASAIGIGIGAAVAFYGYAYASGIRIAPQEAAVSASREERAATESLPPWHQMDPQAGRLPSGSPAGPQSPSATRDPSTSRAQGVTAKYTVFKSVERGAGHITTGWDFVPGDNLPNEQYSKPDKKQS